METGNHFLTTGRPYLEQGRGLLSQRRLVNIRNAERPLKGRRQKGFHSRTSWEQPLLRTTDPKCVKLTADGLQRPQNLNAVVRGFGLKDG